MEQEVVEPLLQCLARARLHQRDEAASDVCLRCWTEGHGGGVRGIPPGWRHSGVSCRHTFQHRGRSGSTATEKTGSQ